MKISFLSDSESGVNIFPELADKLREEVADIETDEVFVPRKEDIPKKAMELCQETDLVFVLCLYPEPSSRYETILSKLIDVELKTGISIAKAFEQSDIFDLDAPEEIALEKEALAKKWGDYLVNLLFHQDHFVPEK